MKSKYPSIVLITLLISIQAHATDCDYNGKAQVVGATIGPYICSEKGKWLNQKDACIYNGKPYELGTTIGIFLDC